MTDTAARVANDVNWELAKGHLRAMTSAQGHAGYHTLRSYEAWKQHNDFIEMFIKHVEDWGLHCMPGSEPSEEVFEIVREESECLN